jgi:hypothetical protein
MALGGADIVLFVVNTGLNNEQVKLLREYVEGAGRSALTVLGILSKADLVGTAEDPWPRACKLAESFSGRMRREVAAVLPVLGLLAQTAETSALNEQHAADLAALSDHGIGADHSALFSADHFDHAPDLPVPIERRRGLVNILGMYGIKVGIGLAAGGVRDAGGLQSALAQHTGLVEVRRTIAETFAPRADVLKTSSALKRMELLSFRGQPADTTALRQLRARIEELRDDESMHQIAEFEALHDSLKLNHEQAPDERATRYRITLPDSLYDDVLRLIRNTAATTRCGLDSEATNEELMRAARAGADKWMTFANSRVGATERKIAHTIHQTYTMIFMEAKRSAGADGA